jgi:glycosyltransferase involved in cell wall biosynthesis
MIVASVSVVIPLYNKVRHIRRTIESVLAQTYADFELLVIDDGSTDGSGAEARQCTDPRVRVITQVNAGECAARNRGIAEAACELVAFLDADDEWLPCFLETVMGLRARHPAAGIYATAFCTSVGGQRSEREYHACPQSPEGGLIDDYFRAACLGDSPAWSSCVMIPKAVLVEVGGFPVGVRTGGDLNTWVRIALRYRVAWSKTVGAVYHLSADNRVSGSECKTDVAFAAVVEEFLASGQQPITGRTNVEEFVTRIRLVLAKNHLLHGKKSCARDLYRRTRGTVLFKKRRRNVGALLLLPSWLLRTLSSIAQKFRTKHGP